MESNPSIAPTTQQKLLDPCELGTKEYWDAAYEREGATFADGAGADEGTVWFSESGAEEAVRTQLRHLARTRRLSRRRARFLDLGTGNGHMLFALREDSDDEDSDDDDQDDEDDAAEDLQNGPTSSTTTTNDGDEHNIDDSSDTCWNGELIGVDYSAASVALARDIAAHRSLQDVTFERWDLLADEPGAWLRGGFDVVLDKGTFDAISLMPSPPAPASQGNGDGEAAGDSVPHALHPCDVYRERVVPLVKPGAFLFVTSCNWTRAELIEWLAPTGREELEVFGEAKYPTFTFGGRTGQSIVTVIFRRIDGI